MTLNDLQNKTILEAVNEMDLVKTHIHADEDGNVCAIELKYAPKDRKAQRRIPAQKYHPQSLIHPVRGIR